MKCQCCPDIETSRLISTANQLTGFYMRATLALNGLKQFIYRSFYKINSSILIKYKWKDSSKTSNYSAYYKYIEILNSTSHKKFRDNGKRIASGGTCQKSRTAL